MENYIADWLNLLFRWLHLITGAAWIGTSFYFNWLNHNIRPLEEEQPGIRGGLFAVHGGHFYQVLKYSGAPEQLPKTLHWFKWEAYFTWITGFCLLIVVYYWNANIYLINSSGIVLSTWSAIGVSLSSLVLGWITYDQMCKSAISKKPVLFAGIGFALLTAAAYGFSQVFSPRAAYLHVGAMIGTMMAANVFFVIIPNQQKMVDSMIRGEEPDITLGDAGSLRSLHNNYFTLPVLFIMVSNHFPMTFGHSFNWAVLAAIALIGAGVRHHFNLKHQGHKNVWILPVASVAILALAFVIRPNSSPATQQATARISYSDVKDIIAQRCQVCHSATPSLDGISAAPNGVMYDSHAQVKAVASKIKTQAVDLKVMPPGNLTNMTDEERALLGAWINAGAPQ